MFIPTGGCGCRSLGLGDWSVLSHPNYPIPHAGNETGSVPSLRDCPGMGLCGNPWKKGGGSKIWEHLVGTGVV